MERTLKVATIGLLVIATVVPSLVLVLQATGSRFWLGLLLLAAVMLGWAWFGFWATRHPDMVRI